MICSSTLGLGIYLLTYHQQTDYSEQTNEETKVIQEVVSPEISKLNHTVMNKKQGDQVATSFPSRENTRKNKMDSSTTHHTT